jgi:hypothetical protein
LLIAIQTTDASNGEFYMDEAGVALEQAVTVNKLYAG